MQPHEYDRRILLAVTGLSPQVVTETLYALAVQRQPAFVPTEVHLITTREGAERAKLALLSDDPGWFHRLRSDYGLPAIDFDAQRIHVLADDSGAALDDIRTPQDNLRAADFITGRVRDLTADPGGALHVSIAGGRKTMGFYLGYALSLFGRPQDALSHVLVSEPFESSWNFFYPTPYRRVIEVSGSKLADTADAKVTLAEIPFVSLRCELPRALLAGRASFAETVAAAQAALAPPGLRLDPDTYHVQAAGRTFRLAPAQFALLAVLAHRARKGERPLPAPKKRGEDPEWTKNYLADVRAALGQMRVPASVDEFEVGRTRSGKNKKPADNDYLSQQLSRLRSALRENLDMAAASVPIEGGRGRGYWLALPAEAIRFGPIADPAPQQAAS